MDFSDFTILLARQRSGTNALRSVLESHPDVYCFNEVFNYPDRYSQDSWIRETNYFTFLERYAGGDVERVMPDKAETLFAEFFEYLRTFTDAPVIVVDVKYNQTQFFQPVFGAVLGRPHMLRLARDSGMRVLRITRRHYLRATLSMQKADRYGRHTSTAAEAADPVMTLDPDPRVPLPEAIRSAEQIIASAADVESLAAKGLRPFDHLLTVMRRFRSEDDVLDEVLKGMTCLTRDYTDLFSNSTEGVSRSYLEDLAAWWGLPDHFVSAPSYRKQSSLHLWDALANMEDLAACLAGTEFAHCVTDEPGYVRRSAGLDDGAPTRPAETLTPSLAG